MGFLLSKLLPLALYPLGLALLLQGTALVGRRRSWARGLSVASLLLLWVSAMPLTSRQLIWGLEERSAAVTPSAIPRADAVVVLGGGLRPQLAPRASVEVNEAGDRLLTGWRLMRQKRAPLLVVSGGRVDFSADDPSPPEAVSARTLAIELGVPPGSILINPSSRTTAEEALAIGRLGRQRGWRSVLLVTSAFHMPRALASFERGSGLEVIPVACDYLLPARSRFGRPTAASTLKSLLPDATALYETTLVLKEHLGMATYRLLGRG